MSDIVVAFHRSRRRPIAPVGPPQLFPARVARQVALAHALQARIASDEFETQAQMARALGLTRARISQLFDLLVLAPDIQEEILFLRFPAGVQPLNEAALRPIARHLLWSVQRRAWAQLKRKRDLA
jgi:ParB-like chromosome segregation protein Spo0J